MCECMIIGGPCTDRINHATVFRCADCKSEGRHAKWCHANDPLCRKCRQARVDESAAAIDGTVDLCTSCFLEGYQ